MSQVVQDPKYLYNIQCTSRREKSVQATQAVTLLCMSRFHHVSKSFCNALGLSTALLHLDHILIQAQLNVTETICFHAFIAHWSCFVDIELQRNAFVLRRIKSSYQWESVLDISLGQDQDHMYEQRLADEVFPNG
ncbi:unnamed protein product [Fusarium fujikuroi]|uniref:Uncharacterized protein n=1 Tax=Fusarium fujikuroi TaxID=5127 RepID=A0A2H3S727_FUSFU|nr:uncharacterized protein FFC1_11995 [Fusarium fujikuroi]VTT64975.1 unnamed protein product [Fusarium fujikuroi]VTT78757.1 unnamed protein product [Fusarium fujikuroi]VZH87850.1 unnamed protein product [Fusarium fujikuroi]